MSLNVVLKKPSVDLQSVIKTYKRKDIAHDLNELLEENYKEISKNEVYIKNFLELVSYIYADEQIDKQKSEKPTSIRSSLFNNNFRHKLTELRNYYVHNYSIPR